MWTIAAPQHSGAAILSCQKQMNEIDKLYNAIHYFASYGKVFTTNLVRDFAVSKLELKDIYKHLILDNRFLPITGIGIEEDLFISKNITIKWLVALNVHLAKINVPKLTEHQMTYPITSLIDLDCKDKIIPKVVEYGKQFGLISYSALSQKYIFPLVNILSFINARKEVLCEAIISALETPKEPFEQYLTETLEQSISQLKPIEREILCARESLMGKTKCKLSEIALKYGYTRERIRQLQNSGLKHKVLFHPFLIALLCDIIQRKGSMLYNIPNEERNKRRFLAKCLGVPITEIYNSMLLGASQVLFPPSNPPDVNLDLDFVSKWLIEHNVLCLIDKDCYKTATLFIADWKKKATFTKKLYIVLKQIGQPSHHSRIKSAYSILFPEEQKMERYFYNALGRNEYGIIWTGAKGVFALSEWNCKKTNDPNRTSRRDILKQFLQKKEDKQ